MSVYLEGVEKEPGRGKSRSRTSRLSGCAGGRDNCDEEEGKEESCELS